MSTNIFAVVWLNVCNNVDQSCHMSLLFINMCKVPREVLKTLSFPLGFQHFPRYLAMLINRKSYLNPSSIKKG